MDMCEKKEVIKEQAVPAYKNILDRLLSPEQKIALSEIEIARAERYDSRPTTYKKRRSNRAEKRI